METQDLALEAGEIIYIEVQSAQEGDVLARQLARHWLPAQVPPGGKGSRVLESVQRHDAFAPVFGRRHCRLSRVLARQVHRDRDVSRRETRLEALRLLELLGFGQGQDAGVENLRLGRLDAGSRRLAAWAVALMDTPQAIVACEPFRDLSEAQKDRLASLLPVLCHEFGTRLVLVSRSSALSRRLCARAWRSWGGRLEPISGAPAPGESPAGPGSTAGLPPG